MKWLALLAVLWLAGPTQAQSGNCRNQWSAINDFLTDDLGVFDRALPGLVREGTDGKCRIDGVDLPFERDRVTVATRSIVWSGNGMERFVADGLPPLSLNLSIEGTSIQPDLRNKTLSYLNRIQNQGRTIDLILDAAWDEDARSLTLNALDLIFPEGDYVRFSAEIEGVDLSTRNTMQMSVGSLATTESVLQIRSTRMFQSYFLQPLGLGLLYDSDDPEARVQELKDIAEEYIEAIPREILPAHSRDALLDLLGEMPDPSGTLRIAQTATPGIGPARFLAFGLGRRGLSSAEDIWGMLEGVRLEVTYVPE